MGPLDASGAFEQTTGKLSASGAPLKIAQIGASNWREEVRRLLPTGSSASRSRFGRLLARHGFIAASSGLSAVLVFGQGDPLHMALGVIAAICSGIIIGVFDGLIISRLSVNPLIATLAMASIVRGIVLIASEGAIYRAHGDAAAITNIALGRWRMFPIAGIVFIGSIALG